MQHPSLTVLRLDPADRGECRRAVEEAHEAAGSLDVLVNNAGYGLVGAVEEVSEEQARAILDVDLLGPLWLTQAVLPLMRAQGSGHIVQISSTGGVGAMAMLGLYNAAKWGLEAFTESLAGEVRSMGVRATLVEIGAMDTQWATRGCSSVPHFPTTTSYASGSSEPPSCRGRASRGPQEAARLRRP